MSLIYQWRKKWHFQQLNKQLQQHKPLRLPVSFANAKLVGILFNASIPGVLPIIQRFDRQLQQQDKKVKTLAYSNSKTDDPGYPYPLFGKKEVSFSLQPYGHRVDRFIQTPFDILFNLYLDENLLLQNISARSNAHLRIGPATELPFYYDLMIEMPPGKDLEYFIAQTEKLLQHVNTDQQLETV